ncbi:MAG: EamA family transporter [Gammaproteobacteria bacterium]|nr:EamA family transporter [Gammaproteobacteria bacterium]MYJ52008.1 EamA family transporter [Gammaproteobacteria bacterium]
MKTLAVLALITFCYAGYNLFIKVSMSHAESTAISPIIATICLQASALAVSILYLLSLVRDSVALADLPFRAYAWAIGAGICIGIAEILYFYLFRGFAGEAKIEASTAIPFIVGGTIVIAVVVSVFLFGESLSPIQWIGTALALAGMLVLAASSA